ncbi:T9SS type A sorting domain-containing protein [Longitalea arenae]|uniref:T9SS type A sorting domain-containing protein n=1 Tax=Longitalea arenae TaxID=2812558 RepID=UPI00196777A4|nr:T9SS type A sorting domain-containing protein [Longitalea arenae]
MKKKLLSLCKQKVTLLFVSGLIMCVNVFSQATGYVYKHAPIGGGGFVTGIVTHKTSGDRYCRTDVGGAYRWDAANNKWVQLLDWLGDSQSDLYGVEALALDPQNPNNVYMLCGTNYVGDGKSAILKSTDKGNTFTYTDLTATFKVHGNGSGRGNGERLAVDPKNSNILFCGTRANGLWKSTDAGVTWSQTWSGVTTTANGNGICFVLFDPSSSVVNGATQTIYIGVSRTGAGNIYRSTDGGATFTDITATTGFMPHRAALQGTTMYVTYSDNEGPQSTNGDGKVYKLNTATGVWTNVTPVHSKDYCYGGVSIDPTNVNRVIVSTSGIYWNNQFGTGWADFIFLSTDGGSTWTLKNGTNAIYDANGMEWSRGGAINWMDCIEFDQDNVNRVRVIGGGGVFTCPDITAANPTWKYDVIGIEETALLDGISIPGGPFISSFGDVSGFVHEPLTAYPASKLSPVGGYNNNSIAYAAANPNKVVRVANEGSVVYYSNDKGATWTAAATNMGAAGRVAVSADGGTILHCPAGSSTTYYTSNNGASWSSCSGVSLADAAPVADQVNSNHFYIYHPSTGQLFRSTNKGVSFTVAGTPGASTANHPWESALARTVPGLEGHIWIPLGRNGLKYSTNGGVAYTTLTNVTYCKAIGIGKAMPGASYPTVFIWGTVSGVTGLFRSTDQGATWLKLNDDAHQFAGAPLLIGDMNVAGRVYMSAGGGRGLIYWEPAACTPTAITPYVQLNGGTWQQTANATVAAGGSILFGPQPVQGGSWSWSGPNNFGATTREAGISNIQVNQAGNYVATYTNSGGCQSTQTFNITVTGSILRQYWTGISGTAISNLTSNTNYPNNPSGTQQLTSLECPTNWADNYGTRVRGYIHPTASGSYTFWLAGDDNTELYLSTSDNPAGAARIAYVNGWTNSREWTKYSTQQSAAINLVAGQKYYIEVLHKEGSGGDNVAVAWQGPGITRQVIAANYLSPFIPGAEGTARISTQVNMNEAGISLYPNPASKGRFTILLPEITENAVVRIYDNLGRMLYEKVAKGNNRIEIDARLKAGLYHVRINSKGSAITRKLIVK